MERSRDRDERLAEDVDDAAARAPATAAGDGCLPTPADDGNADPAAENAASATTLASIATAVSATKIGEVEAVAGMPPVAVYLLPDTAAAASPCKLDGTSSSELMSAPIHSGTGS